MTKEQLLHILSKLRGFNAETEVFELKEAKNGFDFARVLAKKAEFRPG